jgi:putative sterol carrier protein
VFRSSSLNRKKDSSKRLEEIKIEKELRKVFIMSPVAEIKKKIEADSFGGKDLPLYLQAMVELAGTNNDLKAELSHIANVIFQFNVAGAAQASLEIKGGKLTTKTGARTDANVILELTEEVFKNIFTGKTDISTAYIDNAIKVAGNLTLTNDLQSLIKIAVDVFV